MESVQQFDGSSNPATRRFLREEPLVKIPAPEQPATWADALEREKSDGFLTDPSAVEDTSAVRAWLFTPGSPPRILVSFRRAIRGTRFPDYSPFVGSVQVIYQREPLPRLIEHIYERVTGYEFDTTADCRFSQMIWEYLDVDNAIALARMLVAMAREAEEERSDGQE